MTDPARIGSTIQDSICPECGAPSKALVLDSVVYPQHCDDCMARFNAGEQERREHAERQHAKLINQARAENWHAACPPLYQNSDESRFPPAAWRQVKAWEPGPRGLLLAGPTGRCKTRMVWALLKRLMLAGCSVTAYDSVRFGHDCIDAFRNSDGTRWFDGLCVCSVLFLDDLGKVPATERVEAELFGVIETRIAHERPILATTNAAGAELTARLSADRGAPMIRRLREFCDVIVCDASGEADRCGAAL